MPKKAFLITASGLELAEHSEGIYRLLARELPNDPVVGLGPVFIKKFLENALKFGFLYLFIFENRVVGLCSYSNVPGIGLGSLMSLGRFVFLKNLLMFASRNRNPIFWLRLLGYVAFGAQKQRQFLGGELTYIAVCSTMQGNGLGSQLLKKLIKDTNEDIIVKTLFGKKQRGVAGKFYINAGFSLYWRGFGRQLLVYKRK
ncbi:GNAT family N-acetyltransferase [Alphaproteobacteria bacterium]|nr:GNAT family N-acetyltransferase [Alphaproteobacteria bacterium]